jgi:hypothetical protein
MGSICIPRARVLRELQGIISTEVLGEMRGGNLVVNLNLNFDIAAVAIMLAKCSAEYIECWEDIYPENQEYGVDIDDDGDYLVFPIKGKRQKGKRNAQGN